MKTSFVLNVLLAIALVLLLVKNLFFSKEITPTANLDTTSVVMENILTRTSIRSYQNTLVEDEKVETMLRAAMAAPSAGNKQPWTFVVIKDRALLDSIANQYRTIRMAKNAPIAIVVCGDMTKTFPEDGFDYWVEDTSAATENLLLAAHSMGLGAVWCGVYPIKERVAFIKNLLALPENIVPLNVIPIGYPAEEPTPKDKWKPENVRYDTW